MKLPEPMKQLSDDYVRGWNECLQAVRDLNNTEEKDGDWIPWSGGKCPVKDGVFVLTKWRGGYNSRPCEGVKFRWSHYGDWSTADIVAYKVVGQ